MEKENNCTEPKWFIRRIECGTEAREEDAFGGFGSREAALRRLSKHAMNLGTKIQKDPKGNDFILLLDGADCILYWIYAKAADGTVIKTPANKATKFYQPEMKLTGDVPKYLASFHVFISKDDLHEWMYRMGYSKAFYDVKEYNPDGIEDPTVIDGRGQVIKEY